MRITEHKTKGVTVGVIDKGLEIADDLVSVTFVDHNDTPHTVYAHRDGPFKTPEAIMEAWYQHELHVEPEEPATEPEPTPDDLGSRY